MIEIKGLNYRYKGESAPTLKGIDLQIEGGEIFGLIGPSGAGKSTLQKVLIGLLKEYKGKATILDREIRSWGSKLYERIGVAFELPNHYLKLSALENLLFFASLYSGKIHTPEAVLEMVGLESYGKMKVSQFSKGMKNRLSVARALLHDPEILFLDEPTSGLDPVNAEKIKQLIESESKRGKTIFLTTHHMDLAEQLCNRVGFLFDGSISLIDSPQNLKSTNQVCVELADEHYTFALEGLGRNQEFLDLLSRPIRAIHSKELSLEEIFIQLTRSEA